MSLTERRYRRLLLAYPARFRRRHGEELIGTLLEMPSPTPARHLIRAGIRERFRLPARSRAAWVAAVLIAVIGGGFGAAAGSWLATLTFTAVPAPEALVTAAGGQATYRSVLHTPWQARQAYAGGNSPTYDAGAARQALTAAGWQVTASKPLAGNSLSIDASGREIESPMPGARLEARRGGAQMVIEGRGNGTVGMVEVWTWAGDTGALLPLSVAGAVAGLIAGWLLAAAGAHRARRRRLPAAATGLAVALLALPAGAFYANLTNVGHRPKWDSAAYTVHSALTPGPFYPFGPSWLVLGLTIAGAVMAVIAAALVNARREAEEKILAAG